MGEDRIPGTIARNGLSASDRALVFAHEAHVNVGLGAVQEFYGQCVQGTLGFPSCLEKFHVDIKKTNTIT